MMKDYDGYRIGECWKGQNISLGDTEAFNMRNCSKGHDGLFQKVPWTLAAATIPLAEGQMRAGSFPISSCESEHTHAKFLLLFQKRLLEPELYIYNTV